MKSVNCLLIATLCSIATEHAGAWSSCTTAQRVVAVTAIPRGGGWFPWSSNVEDRYRQVLEDQIQNLERQVRAAKDEATQMRQLLKLSSRKVGVDASMKTELSLLQEQVKQLQAFQKELEALLKDEQKMTAALEKKLASAGADSSDLQTQHKVEMEMLEKTLIQKSKKQLEDLQTLMEQRVKEAAERARQEALAEVDAKVKVAVSKVEQKAKADLEQERKRAADAVEKERAKMRKLVKALAEREKKVGAKAGKNSAVRSNPASMSARKPKNPTSVRSPIK